MERRIKGDVKPTRSNSSNRWMHEHVTDPFVQRAKQLGYRSRAAFKIIELDEKYGLFRRGMTVVDLGAAPGGWSQIAAPRVGNGRVVAIDLLPMQGMAGVEMVQTDFTTQDGLDAVVNCLGGESVRVDLVMSDMAPNISGIAVSDQARSMHLCDIALDFAARFLKPDGAFVVKSFQGAGFTEFLQVMRSTFTTVKSLKPKSSRDRSAEMYLIGRGRRVASA